MNNLLSLLTTFTGRISRRQWWIGLVVISVADIAGGMLINPDYFFADERPPKSRLDTLWQIALLVPMTAITVKRFNDTDHPAWFGYLIPAFGLFGLYVVQHLREWTNELVLTALFPILLLMCAYALFTFANNGFVRDTDGPNRYGPDPLAGAPQSA